jgi:SAM-dependent methyltransferase
LNSTATAQFLDVTELAGEEITQEQLERLCHRYYWAGELCEQRDVLEVACGAGTGLRYLASRARRLQAGDYSPEVLARAKAHTGDDFELRVFDAQEMPYADASFDAVMMLEALYYVRCADRFVAEARRVLRPGGVLLIVSANKDLYDFNPSPFSVVYHGIVELRDLLEHAGFDPSFFGYLRVDQVSLRQRAVRPIKRLAVKLNLMPKTMTGKLLLKRLVFGRMIEMPKSVVAGMVAYQPPEPIPSNTPDCVHKVIYCAARRS